MALTHHNYTPPVLPRIVLTGIGLTSPNANDLASHRASLLAGTSGVQDYEIRYVGKTLAGICNYDALKYQNRREVRRGTRAGSIAIYSCNEAVVNSGIDWESIDKSRVGIYIGVTEHGNVETENEVYELSQFDYDISVWNHFHNPRTVANNPAGEAALNMGITGPHYTLGAACAAGNNGLIQGAQMLQLGQCDIALAGGVSESIHTFGIFASFKSQGALADHSDPIKASRPFDVDRNGIVVSEGGCVYTLERLDDALARGAHIYGEIVGHSINTDATNFVLPNPERQSQCIKLALQMAEITTHDVDILSTHATGTTSGDIQEISALRKVFDDSCKVSINNTKSFMGHCMGAAGALELAGNLPSFEDNICHPTINVDNLDDDCAIQGLVLNQPKQLNNVKYIVNNSFGMLGINSTVVIRKFSE